MAKLAQDLQVHITWDTEPTEKAKDFIRSEAYKALQETFQGGSWLTELVQAEVLKVMKQQGFMSLMHQVPGAAGGR